jgi:hypothetical protein
MYPIAKQELFLRPSTIPFVFPVSVFFRAYPHAQLSTLARLHAALLKVCYANPARHTMPTPFQLCALAMQLRKVSGLADYVCIGTL